MDKGSGLLTSNISVRPKAQPRLRLLIKWESPQRVFWRNLLDFVLFRTTPIMPTTRLAPFWKDVFVDSRLPWWGLFESLLWHLLAATGIWIFSQTSVSSPHFHERISTPSHISYYTPPPSFPALGSNPSRIRPGPRPRRDQTHQPLISRRTESATALSPRDIEMAGHGRSDVTPAPAPAEVRGSSIGSLQLPAAPALPSVVAPPPAVSQTMSRRLGLPGASAVAPPPDVEAISGRSGVTGPSAAAVAPAPAVRVPMRGVGTINIGHSDVVAPAPALPMHEQGAVGSIGQVKLGSPSGAVVPPPPTVQSSGTLSYGRADSGSLSGNLQVIPPPPSVQGAGNSPERERAGSLPGKGWQVVPPLPSIQGAGNFGGNGRGGSLSGTSSRVVPPPPSIQGAANFTGGKGTGSLPGTSSAVVPPPPSIPGEGKSAAGGRTGSLPGTGSAVLPPPPASPSSTNPTEGGSVASAAGGGLEPAPLIHEAGNSIATRRSSATDVHPAVAPSGNENRLAAVTEELSVRLVGLALSLPNSSYFANYEVFIAERRLKNAQSQFIKLVYESLPYQRRLSEYALNSAKVYRLRVRRDISCDESLLQMTWPEGDPHPGSQNSGDSPGLTANDRNNMLPCYRTTADDYRKALSRGR
jgi:hypothetical protein